MFKINVDGEEKEIKLKEPLGKHQREFMKWISKLSRNPEVGLEFIEYRDKLIEEMTNGTIKTKDIDKLTVKEITKLMDRIRSKIFGQENPDFLSNSKKSSNTYQAVART